MAVSPLQMLLLLGRWSSEAYMFNPDVAWKHQDSTQEDSTSLIVAGLERWEKTLTLGFDSRKNLRIDQMYML